MIKVIVTDDTGKVELTKKELEKMLKNAYEDGLKARIDKSSIIVTSQDNAYIDYISQTVTDWNNRYNKNELDSSFVYDFGWTT